MATYDFLLYGANGYTGKLIAERASDYGLVPLLAGRDGTALSALAASTGFDHRVIDLSDTTGLDAALQQLLLPKDPDDERNAFVEVRAGTGGDESALFAGDLARLYTRYAERQGWQVEAVSESPSELGGYKEVVLRVSGPGAYGRLLLMPGAKAPVAVVSKGRQVCTCFNVTEPAIAEQLKRSEGSEDQRLASLQSALQCGTNCGSCVPELRRLVRATTAAAAVAI